MLGTSSLDGSLAVWLDSQQRLQLVSIAEWLAQEGVAAVALQPQTLLSQVSQAASDMAIIHRIRRLDMLAKSSLEMAVLLEPFLVVLVERLPPLEVAVVLDTLLELVALVPLEILDVVAVVAEDVGLVKHQEQAGPAEMAA